MKKERIDVLLVKQGLFDSREQAKRAVMAGEILGENEERLDLYELSFLVQPLFPQHRGYHHKFEMPIQIEFQIALMHLGIQRKHCLAIRLHNRHIESKRRFSRDEHVEAGPTLIDAVHLECRQLAH